VIEQRTTLEYSDMAACADLAGRQCSKSGAIGIACTEGRRDARGVQA
jgi:hypothetical protein